MNVFSAAFLTLILSPLASTCEGFVVPTCAQYPSAQQIRRSLPILHFQEDDNIVATPPTKELVAAILGGEVVPLLGTETEYASPTTFDKDVDGDVEEADVLSHTTTTTTLRPLSFEDDIEKFLDIARPYYALSNEHAIVDTESGETRGFLCTGRVELPAGCENSDIPWTDASRQMGAAGSVAALLHNPQKKRFYYPASGYCCNVQPNTGRVKEEIAKIHGSNQFAKMTNVPIILVRCTDFSKRTAKCQILLEHGNATWELSIEYFIIAGPVFEKMHPARQALHKSPTPTNNGISYESIRVLNNIKSFSDLTGEWLTMEATMPPCKPSDCEGHFQNNPALPHSSMLIPNVDLIGKTISQFTGVSLSEAGIEMLTWRAVPEVLHFPDTCGLKFQCKVFLAKGELGKFGSTYRVESVVKQETGILCYKATGEFILQPKKVHKSEFQTSTTIAEKLPINSYQFACPNGMCSVLADPIKVDN